MTLPVTYKGRELEFPVEIVPLKYDLKFIVTIYQTDVVFERDEGGEFRAFIPNMDEFEGKLPEAGLLQAICNVLESLS